MAPLEPKVKINKTLQINDLRRFSFVKNWHFWCKMTQFSVLFMDIFWIPQKCTLIAPYFTIFQYLTAISTIQYPTLFCRVFSSIRVHSDNMVIKIYTIFSFSHNPYSPFGTILTTSPDIEAQLKLIKLCKRALFQ